MCDDLKKKIKTNIKLITKNLKEINPKDLFNNSNEKIVMLENLRFYVEEEKIVMTLRNAWLTWAIFM